MYNIDLKWLKGERTGYIIIFIIGFIILGVFLGVFLFINNKKNSLDREIVANSVSYEKYYDDEGDLMYHTIYHYVVSGQEYACKSSSSSSSMPSTPGTVYYEKGNPANCMTDKDVSSSYFFLLGAALGSIFCVVGAVLFIKKNKRIKKIKYLATNGKLIKGLPYTLENAGVTEDGKPIKKIAIDYTLPNGLTKHLTSEPIYDNSKKENKDEYADLLIDINDPDNYFIDYDIDYYGIDRINNK